MAKGNVEVNAEVHSVRDEVPENEASSSKKVTFAESPIEIIEEKNADRPVTIDDVQPFYSPHKKIIRENNIHHLLLLKTCSVITVEKYIKLVDKLSCLLSMDIRHGYKKIYLNVDPGNNNHAKISRAIKIIESMYGRQSLDRNVHDFWKHGGKIKILLF